MKMTRVWEISVYILTLAVYCSASTLEAKAEVGDEHEHDDNLELPEMLVVMEEFEKKAKIVHEMEKENRPLDDIEKYYDDMAADVSKIVDLLKERDSAFMFLEAGGIEKIITSHITVFNLSLRTKLLLLLKKLLETAPTTTKAMLPAQLASKIVEIFENDSDIEVKARAMDVFYLWLPQNPKVQFRIMKMHGLNPFYEQALKLDSTTLYVLLDLFNNILSEHLNLRNLQTVDPSKYNHYKKMALKELLSNPVSCNGLINLFDIAWSFRLKNDDLILPVYEITKKMKPYCSKKHGGKNANGNAARVLANFRDHAKDLEYKNSYFSNKGMDINAIEFAFDDYASLVSKLTKEEL